MPTFDVQQFRQQFAFFRQQPDWVYLDNAATMHKPDAVTEAVSRFYQQDNSNVHRGAHQLSQQATQKFEQARDTVAAYLNACAREEIIWCSGATAALNQLAFGLMGTRAIWDPDEGRYTNVALTMLDTGNFVDLSRHHETGHWTKPPVTYWAIAASIAAFGPHPWSARLPAALAFLACTWLAWRVARRLQPGSENMAALAYATMLLPFGAANLITTDFVLAAFQGLAMWAWVESRFGAHERAGRWLLLMWVGFAAAFMTKGPPALLPLLAVVAMMWLAPAGDRRSTRAWSW